MPVIINGTTGISGTDGSAGTPAVQGTDTNTGMFFPAADTIAFSEGGVESMRLDSSGNVTLAGNLTLGGSFVPGSSFLRNRIINGGMEIAQRGTSATGTYNSTYTYTSVDRWAVFSINSSTTQAQSTDAPAGFRNSVRLQRPAGNTGTGALLLGQAIESVNCYDLSGQSVTVSFWAKRGANYSGGNLTLLAVTGTTADQGLGLSGSWAGRQTPISTSFAITTTWTRYTATGTFGAGVLEASVEFSWAGSGTAGADDSVYITGVQLEVGTAATPFERRQFGQELALCQRYYAIVNAGADWYASVGLQVFRTQHTTPEMRTTPTAAILSNINSLNRNSYILVPQNTNALQVDMQAVSGGTLNVGGTSRVILSAEL